VDPFHPPSGETAPAGEPTAVPSGSASTVLVLAVLRVARSDGFGSPQVIAAHIRSRSAQILSCVRREVTANDYPPPYRISLDVQVNGAGYCYSGLIDPGPRIPPAVTGCLSSELVHVTWPRPESRGDILAEISISSARVDEPE
jgi:hypothetical protein